MQKIKCCYFLLLLMCPVLAWAQLEQSGIARTKNDKPSAARVNAGPMPLPFWDDFSFGNNGSASDTLWLNYHNVLVNDGQGINPPTIYVATFDGLNENGVPYSPSPKDILDFGYRDTLESQIIQMAGITVPERNGVYLSFSYQAGGNMEPPDPNDFLVLQLKSSTRGWIDTLTLRVDNAPDPTVFYDTMIRINQNQFYHNGFQFRFISFGRKSGRYDGWNLDYVYMNKGRTVADTLYPDRAIYKTLTPLFEEYSAVPMQHYKTDMAGNIGFPSFGLHTLENLFQPQNFQVKEITTSYEGGIPSTRNVILQNATPVLPPMSGLERRDFTLSQVPDFSGLSTADSIFTDIEVLLRSGDSLIIPAYDPIKFYMNNIFTRSFELNNFYAYDDGQAEYAAGLTTAGNQFAYKFAMKTPGQDTINGVYIHFPYFAGTAASTMLLQILGELTDGEDGVLYEQTINITQKANSEFAEIPLDHGVIVQDTFYISYREPSVGRVRIGLDKSNDTTNKMYYRLTPATPWQMNDRVTGSMMIRPRFGHGDVIITGLPDERDPVSVYPNPNEGGFYLKGIADQINISTITGQSVAFTLEDFGEEKKINLTSAQRGVYILRYRSGQKVFAKKVMVLIGNQ